MWTQNANQKTNSQLQKTFRFLSSQKCSVITCSFSALNFVPAWDDTLRTLSPGALSTIFAGNQACTTSRFISLPAVKHAKNTRHACAKTIFLFIVYGVFVTLDTSSAKRKGFGLFLQTSPNFLHRLQFFSMFLPTISVVFDVTILIHRGRFASERIGSHF